LNQQLVVKLVDRYGVDTHLTLANLEMAPRLPYCGTLDGENYLRDVGNKGISNDGLYIGLLRMVVMDFVECEGAWPEGACDQAKKAIDTLHDEGLVFGVCIHRTFYFLEERYA
jgi:hypothetical protein